VILLDYVVQILALAPPDTFGVRCPLLWGLRSLPGRQDFYPRWWRAGVDSQDHWRALRRKRLGARASRPSHYLLGKAHWKRAPQASGRRAAGCHHRRGDGPWAG